jgi:hypothetical protein
MISFFLRIIIIERCFAGVFPLEEESEHCFLSIKVLFWCCGFIYFVPLLFSIIFMFSAIIIDLVPYKWYHSTFLGRKLWVIFSQGRDVFRHLKATEIFCSTHKSTFREAYTQELQVVLKLTLLATLVTLVVTPFE